MDCLVHGVVKSWTHLSDFHFTSQSKKAGLQRIRPFFSLWPSLSSYGADMSTWCLELKQPYCEHEVIAMKGKKKTLFWKWKRRTIRKILAPGCLKDITDLLHQLKCVYLYIFYWFRKFCQSCRPPLVKFSVPGSWKHCKLTRVQMCVVWG